MKTGDAGTLKLVKEFAVMTETCIFCRKNFMAQSPSLCKVKHKVEEWDGSCACTSELIKIESMTMIRDSQQLDLCAMEPEMDPWKALVGAAEESSALLLSIAVT